MRVLVTGGTGDLGHRVVDRLRARRHEVTIGTRRPDGHDMVAFDLDRIADLGPFETVVHLASDPTTPTRDTDCMRRLVAAATEAGLAHLVFISIVGIDDHPLAYYRAKVEQERILSAGSVPWSILRATQFHSFLPRIGEMLRRGPLTLVPRGYRVQAVDADVVADRLTEIVEAGPSGRVADIGGPQVVGVADALRDLATRAGRTERIVTIPVPGRLGRAFREGWNLLDETGTVVGSPYDAHVTAHG